MEILIHASVKEPGYQSPKQYVGPRAILPRALRKSWRNGESHGQRLNRMYSPDTPGVLRREYRHSQSVILPFKTSDDTSVKLSIAPTWTLPLG